MKCLRLFVESFEVKENTEDFENPYTVDATQDLLQLCHPQTDDKIDIPLPNEESEADKPSLSFALNFEKSFEYDSDSETQLFKDLLNQWSIELCKPIPSKSKKGPNEYSIVGSITLSVTDFLYGETCKRVYRQSIFQSENEESNKNESEPMEIGYVSWRVECDQLFSDSQINTQNFATVKIEQLCNIPETWVTLLNSNTEQKKGGKKNQPSERYYLECNLYLCDSNNAQISLSTENQIEKSSDSDNYGYNWNSNHLIRIPNVRALAQSPKIVLHLKCEKSEDGNTTTTDDAIIGEAVIDCSALFESNITLVSGDFDFNQSAQIVDIDDEKTTVPENEAVTDNESPLETKEDIFTKQETTIELSITYLQSIQTNANKPTLNDIIRPITPPAAKTEEFQSIDSQPAEFPQSMMPSVSSMIDELLSDYMDFNAGTDIEHHDTQRIRDGFTYSLNRSGKYLNMKEQLKSNMETQLIAMDPTNADSLQTFYDGLLSVSKEALSNAIASQTQSVAAGNAQPNTEQKSYAFSKKLNLGRDHLLTKNYVEALSCFQSALKEATSIGEEWDATLDLAQTYANQKQVTEAEQSLLRFCRAHPDHSDSAIMLAAVLCDQEQWDRAEPIISYLAQNPSTPLYLLQALYFNGRDETERSAVNWNRATRNGAVRPFIEQLVTLNFSQCAQSLLAIWESDPSVEKASINLLIVQSKLHFNLREYSIAMAIVQEGLELYPDTPQLWCMYGHVSFVEGNANISQEFYSKYLAAIEKSETSIADPIAVLRLSELYAGNKDWDSAAKTLQQGLNGNENSALLWSKCGEAYYNLDQFDEALTSLKQANIVDNTNTHTWCLLAMTTAALNQYKTAVDVMKEVEKIGFSKLSKTDSEMVNEFCQKLISCGHSESGQSFLQKLTGVEQ